MIINHKGHTIELYSQADKLPIRRYQEFNLNLLIDSGIGSDMQAFQDHIVNVQRLIKTNPEQAGIELQNMINNVHFVLNRMSPKYNAFAVLCKSIDGQEVKEEDLTEEGIKRILEKINKTRLPFSKLLDIVNSVKKN